MIPPRQSTEGFGAEGQEAAAPGPARGAGPAGHPHLSPHPRAASIRACAHILVVTTAPALPPLPPHTKSLAFLLLLFPFFFLYHRFAKRASFLGKIQFNDCRMHLAPQVLLQRDRAFAGAIGNCSFWGDLGDAQHREPLSVISLARWGSLWKLFLLMCSW